jgi:EAL domain-containing protein (putative c-di-GMP-specific phosphodiesterase class I)
MSSTSRSTAGIGTPTATFPFQSYAQLVRMLVPSASTICFYDGHCRPLWQTEGVQGTALRTVAQLALYRSRDDHTPAAPVARGDLTILAIPLRAEDGEILGALGLILQHLPSSAIYRRAGSLEQLLTPLLRVLVHSYPTAHRAAPRGDSSPPADIVAARRAAIIGPASRIHKTCETALVDTPATTHAPPTSEVLTLPLERRIRNALRTNGFTLYAQPIVSLRENDCRARFEVLVRMQAGPTLHRPHAFFDAAKEHHLLADIDRWVLANLMKTMKKVSGAHYPERVFALNVSAESLQRETFGKFVDAQLFRSGLPPHAFVFEFSEWTALTHQHAFEHAARLLRDLGCSVALDNCRSGLDVFRLVQRSPLSCLKLDASLTRQVVTDERAARSIREVAEVASDIGIDTVAECIEDERTCEMLRAFPVDFVQGFHIAEPEPLTDVLGSVANDATAPRTPTA